MKEYKYTIDGKEYQVVIGEIVDNVANVTVNGEEYKVEMEPLNLQTLWKPLPQLT